MNAEQYEPHRVSVYHHIERMDQEEFKEGMKLLSIYLGGGPGQAEDEAQVTSNNSPESLAFQHAGQRWPSTSVEEEKLQDILGPEDHKAIVDKCNHILSLLDRSQVKPSVIIIDGFNDCFP